MLKQLSLTYETFCASDGQWPPSLYQWVAFFGGKLFKAFPIVDWSESFNIQYAGNIIPIAPNWVIVIFAVRIILEVVLLSAAFQVIKIYMRMEDQRTAFLANQLPILDPFLERSVFEDVMGSLSTYPRVKLALQPMVAHFQDMT